MARVASTRLIDAASALGGADRALLNLWIHRNLDDQTLARLTHTSAEAIALRRDGLVSRLSERLALPPETVRDALQELAGSADGQVASNGSAMTLEDRHLPPAVAAPPEGRETARPGRGTPILDSPPSRRRAWIAGLGLAVVVGVTVLLATGGGSSGRPADSGRSLPAPSPVASARHRQAFVPVAGGPAGASGTSAVVGAAPRLRLVLSVTGLPLAAGSLYQLWLYNSIIDSMPLAQLRASSNRFTVALPRDYRRFRWLDISLQPAGAAHHSGVSILRAPTPP